MTNSVIDTFIDTLTYFQSGNWSTFVRAFDLSLGYYEIDIATQERLKLRNYARSYMRHVGLITACYHPDYRWSITRPALVQLDKKYVAIGNFKFRELFWNTYRNVSEVVNMREPSLKILESNVMFYPNIPIAKITKNEAMNFVRQNEVLITNNYSMLVYELLPTISDAQKMCLDLYSAEEFLNPETAEIFNEIEMKWERFTCSYPNKPGLYKNNFEFNNPEYFLVLQAKNYFKTFKITEIDWAYFLHSFLVVKWIKLRYEKDKKVLMFKIGKGKIPEIIEKALRATTFEMPQKKDGWRIYKGIDEQRYRIFKSRIKVFEVEEI